MALSQANYNYDHWPADWKKADLHREASYIKKDYYRDILSTNTPDEVCPCCDEPTRKQFSQFGFDCKTTELNIFGLGFPLYFQLKWLLIALYLIFLLIAAVCCVLN